MTVKKTDLVCLEHILSVDSLALHFNYIEDLLLRKNIAIIFQYLLFLIALDENHSLPGAINYIIYKDMIIHTASITESLLCYGLRKAVEKGKATIEAMDISEEKYRDFKKLYEITSPNEILGGVIKTKKYLEPKDMQFKDLIKASLHVGLINSSLESELTPIRQTRNNIHLSSLSTVDTSYSKATVTKMFNTVKKLKGSIIAYLL
jgi:hypothetical protein